MLIEIIIFFLGLSILFYVLFGGADFGAGVVAIISGTEDRQTIAHAIGPVWEANHVWLILVVVILFMAFPDVYSAMSVHLHIPLLLMLLGIILRGTAFTFMHYDAIEDQSTKVYQAIFKISSVITPLFLGMIVGGLTLGKINPAASNFWNAFISPWLNWFSLFVGFFTLTLFAFLAAVYLIGETEDPSERLAFMRSARWLNVAAVAAGAGVFITAEIEGLPLFSIFAGHWFALSMMIVATLLLPLIWWTLRHLDVFWSRILAALQVIAILLAWFRMQYPVVVNRAENATDLTFYSAAAPDATLVQLIWALAIGSCIILPFLFYLFRVFKGAPFRISNTRDGG